MEKVVSIYSPGNFNKKKKKKQKQKKKKKKSLLNKTMFFKFYKRFFTIYRSKHTVHIN